MTPRQQALVRASEEVDSVKKRLEMDWPVSLMNDPMLPPGQREIFAVRQRDIAALDLASKTVMAVAVDPDNFGACMKLRADKPEEFEAIMVLVRNELERKPEDQQVAA